MHRILCINNYHYLRGGAESAYFSHMSLMQSLNWETACFSMQHSDNEPSPWSDYFVQEIEFGRNYNWHEKIKCAAKIIYSYEARHQLAELLSEFNPNIAHLHNIYHHISPSILTLLKQAGVPVVLTAHDLKLACPAYRMLSNGNICERCKDGNVLNVVARRCIKGSVAASSLVAVETIFHRVLKTWRSNIDRIIVPSFFYLNKLVDWGWPIEQLVYVPNYVDISSFEPNFYPGSYFLYFGRLSPEKGIATLIRANALAGTTLKIVGDGPFREEAGLIADQTGSRVEFTGHQSGDALRTLIRNARAVILPSEWYENAPISLLEAYASGKPVLGADIGGIPELIINGKTGWLFKSGDRWELSTLMKTVEQLDDQQMVQVGSRCRDHVKTHFSRSSHTTALLAVYDELINSRIKQSLTLRNSNASSESARDAKST